MGYTIKQIAEELGISATTVSLIINDRPCRVSDQTRDAVLNLVKKYNYLPNHSARALVTKKTQTVGLILPDISNPFFSELAKGLERKARKSDYSVIFCNSDDQGKKDYENASLLISKQVDGIVIAPSLNDEDTTEIMKFKQLIEGNNLPIVLVDRTIPYCSYNSALINHRQGGYLATEHLLKLGHRKIGCITGPLNVDSGYNRYKGYEDALHMFHVNVDKSYVYTGNYQIESGMIGTQMLLPQGVTAIFACNDLMAFGCLQKCREMGFTPGKDISIIGYDDIPICKIVDPPLTTVSQPLCEIGEISFQIILDLISAPQARIQNITLPPQIIVRNTTKTLNS
jgi:LacI family transcriptional regulator